MTLLAKRYKPLEALQSNIIDGIFDTELLVEKVNEFAQKLSDKGKKQTKCASSEKGNVFILV